MRINHIPKLLLGLSAAVTLAACTSTIPGTATPQNDTPRSGHSSVTTTAPPGSSVPSEQNRPENALALGDLDQRVDAASVGAPYDPCAIGWGAFPAEIRPSKADAKPTLRPPRDTDNFAIACRYDNGDTVEVNVDEHGNASSNTGRDFIALIVWARPGQASANPADHTGATATSFSSKPGLLKPGQDSKGNAMCTAIVQLTNGAGGVSLTNGRFAQVDTCSIARTVADKIAATAP
ncbi:MULTISPECIES: DUF3558 domain-containing protein [Actinosynnema]|uniref:DUF3558 domain-containing protein n=1 Tax=Actinosynnema TaxID=40566 RepID=UPI0020A586D5|nr:DUF3558 domain-containing protein [Actinosynnema pretiosum]MCP2097521.1 Protein of unknown function (DUF3558) [Actinosynnema pretiosum]